ncbi:MAG: hypothetical protein ACOC0H_04430 [Thermodesulfobacteriota bacterium]
MTNEILEWLTRNSSLISALSSLFMVLIWVFYAHLLYRDFRTRNHPRVIIQQAPDRFIDSVCLIVNMSRQIVNIAGIISVGKGMDGTKIKEITDYRQYSSDEFSEKEIQTLLKQGPLASGDFISLGSFEKIIPETLHTHQMTSFWQRRRVKTWMKQL